MYWKSEVYGNDLKKAFDGTVNLRDLYHGNILIAGATGLIGSFIADVLLYANETENAGIGLYLLARNEERIKERFRSHLKEENLHFLIQDVTEPLKTDVHFDYMIQAAGDGFPSAFREHPVETMTPALFGTCQLLQYAKEKGLKKFLYISSGEIYGKLYGEEHAFREEDCGYLDSMDVRSCYPMAKRCAETLCVSYGKQYCVPVVAARPGHTYGVCNSARDNRATVQFLNRAVMGETIVMHSEGKQMRSYTYVADCVSGILTVLLNGRIGEAYNIANADSRVTIAEFARILAQKAGVECVRKMPDAVEQEEHTPIEYAVLDSAKLEGLGWHGQYGIEQGIENMLVIRKNLR